MVLRCTLPNNAGAVYRSHPSMTFYNGYKQKYLGINENDVYQITVVFRCSAANANQTYLEFTL
jgi:long-subunit fatty acid transport protein